MTDVLNFISLGAGVQSSTMALMAAAGQLAPMPAFAVFADTGDEPEAVYRWLDWLSVQLPFPVVRVRHAVLSDDAVLVKTRRRDGRRYIQIHIPAYTVADDGGIGLNRRQCTRTFKIEPVLREAKRRLRLSKMKRARQWIGISRDEVFRIKPSRVQWVENCWPLVDRGIDRRDCLRWMKDQGYPEPPRSACVFCPYHSDAEWRRLKKDAVADFAKAVAFEQRLQAALEVDEVWSGTAFLHRSAVPLDQVDFGTEEDRGQISLFDNECEGMCGV